MKQTDKRESLLQAIEDAARKNELVKLTLGHARPSSSGIKNIYIKPVTIKSVPMLSFVLRNPTNDITKNYTIDEARTEIKKYLQTDFFNADLVTATQTIYFSVDKAGKEKLVTKGNKLTAPATTTQGHDREKQRLINPSAVYLYKLGVTSAEGHVLKDRQQKYRQINRYVEIIDGILKDLSCEEKFIVADMGSGKGYLTFALYDHLTANHINADITGIEMRDDLVKKCNDIAKQSGYSNLHFKKGSISDTELKDIDMLIALHACDTATDDAIYKGIKAEAEYIICAPCCHKQIRRQMQPVNALSTITRHGILLERQAETVTDTIRALILEAHGYKTKVFAFIDEADTPKNVMIAATKRKTPEQSKENIEEQIKSLKSLFGIKEHYLETLFAKETASNQSA